MRSAPPFPARVHWRAARSRGRRPAHAPERERFGGIVAGNIVAVDMAALAGDFGVVKVGQARNQFTDPTAMLNFGGKGNIPASVVNLVTFGTESIPSGVRTLLDMNSGLFSVKDDQATPVTRVKVGKLGAGPTDYGLEVYDTSGDLALGVNGLGATFLGPMTDFASNYILNPTFEQGAAFWRRDPATAGSFTIITVGQLEGSKSLSWTCGTAASRLQQCRRQTDVNDSTSGTLVFIPVQPDDAVWASAKVNLSAAFPTNVTMVVEEYNASQTFIQRTTLDSFLLGGSYTVEGGTILSSSTRYIVFGFAWPGHGASGGTVKLDAVFLRKITRSNMVYTYKSGAVQSLTSGIEAALTFDAEVYDISQFSSIGMHDNVSQNTRITSSAAGGIRLLGQVAFAANATGYRRLRWRKNGASILATVTVPAGQATIDTSIQIVAYDRNVARGDYYELLATQNSGGALNVQNGGREITFAEAIHDYSA